MGSSGKPENAIQRARWEKQMSQKEVADHFNIASSRMSLIETTGVNLSYELAAKIATFYGKPVEDLFEIEYKPFVRGIKP
jgi:DNA-binding XRE family transcriptional regulator